MANTLSNLLPELYANLDVVSRELVGMIPSVTMDATASRAAKNQTVRNFVAPASTASDVTPGLYAPDVGDQTIGNTTLTISKVRKVPIRWNGEEELNISTGHGAAAIRANQIQQAFRTLANEIETDLCALHLSASRAAGAAASTPFATANDYTAASLSRKILVDNGAPQTDLKLVIDTAAGANLRGKQAAVDASGTTSLLRQGVLLDINGMEVRESGQIVSFTAGSFSAGTLTSAVRAVGATSLVATADYTAGLAAGDMITLAHESDAHKYMVTAVAAGSITIAAPGLRTATAATGTVAITKIATSRRNLAFHRGAIVLASRLPALPAGGDSAIDRATVVDPRSGMAFEIAQYAQYRQMYWEVSCAWGVAAVKTEHLAVLLG